MANPSQPPKPGQQSGQPAQPQPPSNPTGAKAGGGRKATGGKGQSASRPQAGRSQPNVGSSQLSRSKISQSQVGAKPSALASLQILPTLTLLTLMAIIGAVSAIIGYTFGQNSLKGTTQPVVNPIFGVGGSGAQTGTAPQETVFRRESDIIAEVKAATGGTARPSPEASPSGSPSPSPSASPSPSGSPSPAAARGLPQQAQASDVTFAIRSSQRQSGDLVLNVSLHNKGKRAVQFLYTFLEVTDDRGRPLTAVTSGLPTELKANSGEIAGTITIPAAALDGAKAISVVLSDYPNQSVSLAVNNIKVD
jgi:hypothetical protein